MKSFFYVGAGLMFPFLMTAAGALVVCFIKIREDGRLWRLFLGFAAGIMMAASIWSLLLPSIDAAGSGRLPAWFPAAGGVVLGGAFLQGVDWLMAYTGILGSAKTERQKDALLILAVTVHNIPEGMAVGLAFAMYMQAAGDASLLAAAAALSMGIGIQNFPEGAAVALPLYQERQGRGRAFLWGAASGAVEPAAGLLAFAFAGAVRTVQPWMLAFAAGAMLYVVVQELIPRAAKEGQGMGTAGFLAGFLLMMVLDVALG